MFDAVLETCIREGFFAADVFQERLEKREFLTKYGKNGVHQLSANRMAVRAFWEKGDPIGFSLSIPSQKEVKKALADCKSSIVPGSGKNIALSLPRQPREKKIRLYDPAFFQIDESYFSELADRIAEASIAFPGLKIGWIGLSALLRKINLANSWGWKDRYKKTVFTLNVELSLGGHRLSIQENRVLLRQLNPERLLARASNLLEVVRRASGPPGKTSSFIFAPEAATAVLREFAPRFKTGQESLKSRPWIGSAQITLSDHPLREEECGSAPFDDEGIACREHVIIKKGVFLSPVRDLRAGLDAGGSTGNGFREEKGVFPAVQFTNLHVKPSPYSFSQLLSEAKSGVLIMLVRPKGTSPSEGEGLFSAYGYRFNGGEIGDPVYFHFFTSSRSFLSRVLRVSRELKFFYRRFSLGSPYLLMEGSGEQDGAFIF